MQADVTQDLTGVLMVVRELGTTVVMVPCPDGVDTLTFGLHHETMTQLLGNAVNAAHGRYNPYLVTYTDISVLTDISLKGPVFVFDTKFLVYRMICIL
jgi:hypothetical protein